MHQSFKQSLTVVNKTALLTIFVLVNLLSEYRFLRTVSRMPRANGERTFLSLNQPSYREYPRPTDCVKPWFGLDLV